MKPAADDGSDDEPLRFREAAISAELETGRRETTSLSAWRYSVLRIGRVSLGLVVVVMGGIMLALPGPGLLVLAIGLGILSRDVAWADRLLQKVRTRLPSDDQGRLPRSVLLTMILLTLAGIALSLAYALGDWGILFWTS